MDGKFQFQRKGERIIVATAQVVKIATKTGQILPKKHKLRLEGLLAYKPVNGIPGGFIIDREAVLLSVP